MVIKDIFLKPVDRLIEGVIKADDESSLLVEVEEYVITNEIAKRIDPFFDEYNEYKNHNGVWISGFFGSGKSHLLKMLSLILENRFIDGRSTLDIFLPKCEDAELQAKIKKAASMPSKSILFNIGQKASSLNMSKEEALVYVFFRVFDEMCGYFGASGYIAQFERDLDNRGKYEDFKSEYQTIAGKTWESGREEALLEADNIDTAYAKVIGVNAENATGILNKYRSDYSPSIEDFCTIVSSYINKQPPGFRLNFFVDEVGQYIAGDVGCMLKLQTIAETLATKCQGRAWVIVTSQQGLNEIIGDVTTPQGEDFSRIQARFDIRMNLTSVNVDEVIQKRLLAKNDSGISVLAVLYEQQNNNFKTMFDFADGSKTYRNYRDKEHFINSYPFVPYQFDLFQRSIQSLSQHNAFEGRQSSVGERSMLGVFQHVAITIDQDKIGKLATFDLMYDGISKSLKSQIQSSVLLSERLLDNPFAIKVLKALFLVKYLKDFRGTVRNIQVLLQDSFDTDLPLLRDNIQQALNLLESQSYIQRHADTYEFLTDDERDVEEEIKNTEVDNDAISSELYKIIFEQVINEKKIRVDEYDIDYDFAKKLDDKLYGHDKEIGIHIISPFHENAGDEGVLRMQSMGRDELVVILPLDDKLVRELVMYKKTEKHIKLNYSTTQQDNIKRILEGKGTQNTERLSVIRRIATELLSNSKLIISGNDIEVGSKDAKSRIVAGFHELVKRVYTNLGMLKGIKYTDESVQKALADQGHILPGSDETSLSESEQEVLNNIRLNSTGGTRTTIKKLTEKFSIKPYGWGLYPVLTTVAKLCARGKIELSFDSNILESDELLSAILNTHKHPNIIVESQQDYTQSQIRKLKDFYEGFFNKPSDQSDAKSLARECVTDLKELYSDLHGYQNQTDRYPFLSILDDILLDIKELTAKPYTYFLTDFTSIQDDWLYPNICVLENISIDEDDLDAYMNKVGRDLFTADLQITLTQFTQADNLGSLIRPALRDVTYAKEVIENSKVSADLFLASTHNKVLRVLEQADYLSQKYHIVVANPPYMSSKGMNSALRNYLTVNYADVKSDLFSAFIFRNIELTIPKGQLGFMTPFTWMFISSYAKLRARIVDSCTITSLVQPELHSFFDSAYVSVCAFALTKMHVADCRGAFINLSKFYGAEMQPQKALEAIRNPHCGWFFRASSADFKRIPSSPIVYWLGSNMTSLFCRKTIDEYYSVGSGLSTSDNERFVRYSWEVSLSNIAMNVSSCEESIVRNEKWYLFQKGGEFRKWYGNQSHIVNWQNNGKEIKRWVTSNPRDPDTTHWSRRIFNTDLYFRKGITWSTISSGKVSFRIAEEGTMISNAAGGVFGFKHDQELLGTLLALNSKLWMLLIGVLNPTMNYSAGIIQKAPAPDATIGINGERLVCLSRDNWNCHETSLGFGDLPLLRPEYHQPLLSDSYSQLREHWQRITLEVQQLEEENNRLFIEAYNLQEELTPDVPILVLVGRT